MLRICLLGQFRTVLPDAAAVDFPTHSTAALLACLALEPGRRLRRAALAEQLWPDLPPERAAASLRTAMWRLRQALGPAGSRVLGAERDAVWLEPGPDVRIDVVALRAGEAPADLEWPLLDGWSGEWVESARTALLPAFLEALARQGAAALAAGQSEHALAAARRMAEADPSHEEAHRLAMAAHLAQGNPAAALRQYRACRATLARELGVVPDPETVALARHAREMARIMNATAAAGVPPDGSGVPWSSAGVPPDGTGRRPPPHWEAAAGQGARAPAAAGQPAAAEASLVGRRAELEALDALLDSPGPRQAVLLGEPGVGKTLLLQVVAERARRRGCRVLLAQCHDGAEPPPYQALADLLRSAGARTLAALPAGLRAGLALLLPELGAATPTTPGEDRRRLLDAAAGALAAVAAAAPVLVAIEDLHWSDPASVAALGQIWPRLAGPAALVATCRIEGLADRADLAEWAERNESADRLMRLVLAGLSPAETAELAGRLAPGSSPLLSRWLHRETGGNPLFIAELVQAALDNPGAPPEKLPPGIIRVLRGRLAALPEPAQELLQTAAVLGLRFAPEDLAGVLEWPEADLLAHLEDLVRRGLLVEGAVNYEFYHARFREAVLAGLSAARHRALHRRAARAITVPTAVSYHAWEGQDWCLAAQAARAAGAAAAGLGGRWPRPSASLPAPSTPPGSAARRGGPTWPQRCWAGPTPWDSWAAAVSRSRI